MAKSPLRTDLELLGRLTSKNPLLPLPDPKQRNPQIAHAPKRNHGLSTAEKKVCVKKLEKLNKYYYFFCQITTFIKVCAAFVFGLQIF